MSFEDYKYGDLFDQKKKIASTAFSDIYDASLADSSERRIVVVSKFKISKEKDFTDDFKKRLSLLPQVHSKDGQNPLHIDRAVVDADGFPFAMFNWKQTSAVVSDETPEEFSLAVVIKMLQFVNDYHEAGLIFGDVCKDAFRFDSDSEVLGFSPFGIDFSSGSYSFSSKSFKSYSYYFAPELRIGRPASQSSDVFALGVLLYEMICGRNSITEIQAGGFVRHHPAPTEVSPSIPAWIDVLLAHCLSVSADKRPQSAAEILTYLEEGVRNNSISLEPLEWGTKDLVVQGTSTVATREKASREVQRRASSDLQQKQGPGEMVQGRNRPDSSKKKRKKRKRSSNKNFVIAIWAITGIVILTIGVGMLSSYRVINIGGTNLPGALAAFAGQLEEESLLDFALTATTRSDHIEARKRALSKLLGKDIVLDKALHAVFINEPYLYRAEFKEIFDDNLSHWMDELGYDLVINEVNSLLEFLYNRPGQTEAAILPYMSDILSLISPQANASEKQGAVFRIFEVNSDAAFRLVSLLSEESSATIFTPIFRTLVSNLGYYSTPESLSGRELFVLAPACRTLFGASDLNSFMSKLDKDKLKFIATAALGNVQKRDSELLISSLSNYLDNVDFNASMQFIVDLAAEESRKGSTVGRVLYRLVLGTATGVDMNELYEWSNKQWEPVILNVLVTSNNNDILRKSLEILDRRRSSDYLVRSIVKWLRGASWKNRHKYAYSIGAIGLRENADGEMLDTALDKLMPISHGGLFEILREAEDTYIRLEAVRRIGPILQAEEILPLLSDASPEVRIAAVKSLKTRNDIHVLQAVKRAYAKEENPDVKEAYNKHLWVTRRSTIPSSLREK